MQNRYSKKSYAKVNIFLKIAGKRDNNHLLVSRFCRVKSQYDTIEFIKGNFNDFTLDGNFGCELKSNTIYKAYLILCDISNKVKEFFKNYKVVVDKKIPEFAGLGGGSSNCATFIIMVNDICKLNLDKDRLSEIGATIGADIPFFIYEYDSANVTGVGEVVEKFDEDIVDITTITPNIKCNTGDIFKNFSKKFYKEITKDESLKLLSMKSKDILKYLSIEEANDLYISANDLYPNLKKDNLGLDDNYYFSGSGSSFFRIN